MFRRVVRIYKDNKYWSTAVIDSRFDNVYNNDQAEEYIKKVLIPKKDTHLYDWSCLKK